MRVSIHTVSAALLACLLSTFHAPPAEAEGPTTAQAGRIYVGTIYRVAQPVRADGAIIAVDPLTGDWQIIVEKDATQGGAGDAVRLSPDRQTLVFWRGGDGIWKCESDGQFPVKIFNHQDNWLLRQGCEGRFK